MHKLRTEILDLSQNFAVLATSVWLMLLVLDHTAQTVENDVVYRLTLLSRKTMVSAGISGRKAFNKLWIGPEHHHVSQSKLFIFDWRQTKTYNLSLTLFDLPALHSGDRYVRVCILSPIILPPSQVTRRSRAT